MREKTNKMQPMFIFNNITTCFGNHYAHLQENKTYYCMWCAALVLLDAVIRLVLLKMGIMIPETCWEIVKNKRLTVASCWFSLSLHILEYFTNCIHTIYSRGPVAIYTINARHRGSTIINKLMQVCVKMYKNQDKKCILTVLVCMILWNRVHFTHCKTFHLFLRSYLLNRRHDNS